MKVPGSFHFLNIFRRYIIISFVLESIHIPELKQLRENSTLKKRVSLLASHEYFSVISLLLIVDFPSPKAYRTQITHTMEIVVILIPILV